MGNIVVLDELTINKIAAGEVIERPASVIKEMVENSIDAGARNINIEIKNGGISYIRITDDGKGIEQEDLELSFERHATSKIRSADDLNEVKSMGFRGEALASIAAIAKVEMKTKTREAEIGHRIVVEGGSVLEVEEIGCPSGTTITVENLFYNTPVRYKFLKKDYTETGYIEDVVTRLSLVHPDISFRLINSGKTIIQTTGDGDIKNVIYSIYGKDVASACLNVNYTYEGITVKGVVGKPEIARSNRGNQIFFVNKRYIKDRVLSNATEKAFKGMIPIGKFGFIILDIDMLPSLVDVNVHPAKLEVRFQDEQTVFKAVYYAIQDTLLKAELIANSETPITGKIEKTKEVSNIETIPEEQESKNSITNLFRKISRNNNKEFEYGSNNLIESIYKSKEKAQENLSSVQEENTTIEEPIKNDNILEFKKVPDENTGYTLDNIEYTKKEENQNPIFKENPIVSENNEEYQAKSMDVQRIEQIIADLKKNKAEFERKTGINIEAEMASDEKLNKKPQINSFINESETKKVEQNEQINATEQTEKTEENNTQNIVEEIKENNLKTEQLSEQKSIEANIPEKPQNLEGTTSKIKIQDDTATNLTPGGILTNLVKERNGKNSENEQGQNNNSLNFEEKFDDMYEQIFGKKVANKLKEEEEAKKSNAQDIVNSNMSIFENEENIDEKIPYKFIGIAFNTYIILEIQNELYILDQHAAHERIMYEKVKKNYYSNEEKDSQLMLLPDIITLTHKEMDIARENMDKFEKAGFVLEEFGENTIKLTGVPNICLDLNTKELFLETLDEINTIARTAKQEIEERFIATIACKAAVKANMALTEEEVTSLLDQLLALKNPFTCPHGRPTAIKLSKTDIEKKFARRK